MLFQLTSCFVLLLSFSGGQDHNLYDGYKIYDIYANNALQKASLLTLTNNPHFDFFSLPRALDEPARVMVTPQQQPSFETEMGQLGTNYTVIDHDVGVSVRMERLQQDLMRSANIDNSSDIDFRTIHRFDEINAYLDRLAQDYPTRAFVRTAGFTFEGREMKTITISNGDGRADKKIIFVDAGIHAREWIAPAGALYLIQQLVENFGENSALLADYDWIVLPVVNPDGYEFSLTDQRLWRKTRKPVPVRPNCVGTDGNRNFNFHWGEIGASSTPCDATYMGTYAFSEPETRVVRDVMLSAPERLKFYLSLHSYGRYLLYPWGFTPDLPENWPDLDRVAKAGARAMYSANGATYKVGSSTNVLYAAAGGSDDYALGEAGIPIAITMELPGGANGFTVLPQEILPMVSETWTGIKAMAEEVIANY